MSIRLKLVLAFNLFLAGLAAVGFFTFWQLERSQHASGSATSPSIDRVEHAAHLAEELAILRSLELAYILEQDPISQRTTGFELQTTLEEMETHVGEYAQTFTEEPAPPDFSRLQQDYPAYLALHEGIVLAADAGRREEALALYGASNDDFQAIVDAAHNLRHAAYAQAEAATGEAGSLITRTQYTLIGGLLATALLVFAIGHPSSIYIRNRLRALLEGTERVSRGELDQPIGTHGEDEFGIVAGAFDSMMQSLRSARDELAALHDRALAMHEERISLLQDRMAQVVKAQEGERQRVARELHDQAGQTLTALQLGLSQMEGSGPTPDVQEEAAALRRLALEAMRIIRNLTLDLRPSALDELGLPLALRDYTETYTDRTGIPVDLTVTGAPQRLPAETEVTLFRIVQEALTNVAKHAQASQARVTLALENPVVTLTIEDDGVGFDVARALGAEQRRSLGLIGMQERCRLIDGELQIWTSPGEGTRLVITVPRAAATAAPAEAASTKQQ